MLGNIVKGISKVFGNKSERDVKSLTPIVEQINVVYDSYHSLSDDEIRGKTAEFKERIKEHLSPIDNQIDELNKRIEALGEKNINEKEDLYEEIEELDKEHDKELEVVLEELLPEAYAIVKQTAKRLSENKQLVVKANDRDKDLSIAKDFVTIDGENAVYGNSWDAAGAKITWNMVHYDVQLIGGIVLHQGKVAEMQTGEGKTLVSTLPAYLNAISGKGVHLITVNDYLARRDCEWNAPIFEFHGIKVDCLDYHRPNSDERREAYLADITYGTNNEFGFDYLRDNMAHRPQDLVQRKHHFAMIDEVDSVLIDDARTPLIISGPVPRGDIHEYEMLKPSIQKLVDEQRKYVNSVLNEAKKLIKDGKDKEGGLPLFRAFRGLPKNKALIKFLGEPGLKQLLLKTENIYLADNKREMPKADEPLFFTIDEKLNSIELTDKGIDLLTSSGEDNSFFILPDVGGMIADIENDQTISKDNKLKKKDELMRDYSIKSERIHATNQLLKAYTLFEKDVEYIIQENKVKIVDEQTGRVMDGRRYSDGLHQAIEAKENVKVEDATQTFATITLQNYFRMYHKLSGMTGTAETEAGELWEIYKLDVVVIPTNRPLARADLNDLVYRTVREKFNAVIDKIGEIQAQGRPILVGTTSVEVSEVLSKLLGMRKISHNVLNAKQHQREAEIVATAGLPGAITIATNMAGRGTDIKISEEVKAAGGLAIIGTERHESRRVDRQLRGRAGRQGDPGSSQFFISLEDNLMRMFGSERVSKIMDRLGYDEGEVIEHKMISNTIERSQKKLESNHFGTRKRLLEYDDVMNKQRTVIYKRRKNALFGDKLSLDLNNMIYTWCEDNITQAKEYEDYEIFKLEILRVYATEIDFTEEEWKSKGIPELTDEVFTQLITKYHRKNEATKERALPVFQGIYNDKGDTVERVSVPFYNGVKEIPVVVPLKETLDTNGTALVKSFEKGITLELIDESWKEHLRDLDDLKQASNNASIEQKDPLLIYKLESFNLFKNMVSKLDSEILTNLFISNLGNSSEGDVRQVNERTRTDMSKMEISRNNDMPSQELSASGGGETRQRNQAPIKVEKKVGRNEPCPCGSGKKYKSCHGKA
jgi:preprotein translocase subunit SecA